MVSDHRLVPHARVSRSTKGSSQEVRPARAVWAALQLAPELRRDDVVIVLGPEFGTGVTCPVVQRRVDGRSRFPKDERAHRGRLLQHKGGRLPGMIHLHPGETVRQAIQLSCASTRLSGSGHPGGAPLAEAEVVGAVRERGPHATRRCATRRSSSDGGGDHGLPAPSVESARR